MDERVRVGILGCGHVGGALVRLIHDHADVIEARAGCAARGRPRRRRPTSTRSATCPLPAALLHR